MFSFDQYHVIYINKFFTNSVTHVLFYELTHKQPALKTGYIYTGYSPDTALSFLFLILRFPDSRDKMTMIFDSIFNTFVFLLITLTSYEDIADNPEQTHCS